MKKIKEIWTDIKWGVLVAFGILFTFFAIYFAGTVIATNILPKESPSFNRQGATGQCNDKKYTYSLVSQGACSSHGGVKDWY